MAHTRVWSTLVGCGVICWWGIAGAQTFYKWTDQQGIVHFSDVPPTDVKNVEERSLPSIPSAPAAEPEGGEARTPGPNGAEGPARVVVTARHAPRTGPSAVHVSGEVKNLGGSEARNVSVTVTANDVTAGTPCLHADVVVTPSSLRPGEIGNFDADIDDPCLSGSTPIEISTSSE